MSKYPIPQPIIDDIKNLEHNKPTTNIDDFNCIIDFLKQYGSNKATFEAYRRELERLIQWTWLIAKKSLLELKRVDIETYIQFCLHPPKTWIGFKRTPRFIERNGERKANKAWRPFVATVNKQEHKQGKKANRDEYQLSQKAIQEIFTVLSSFYNYLLLEDKVPANPVALIKQKNKYIQKQQQQKIVMRLSDRQWQFCLEAAKGMASAEPEKHERTLFMLTALYLLYLRISELAANERWVPEMRHFHQDSHGRWWFKTVGKGNKMRDIAVSDDMLQALKRYRKNMDLSALPLPNENTPLFPKVKGQSGMTSTRHIRRLVQMCFDKAIEKLTQDNFLADAESLEAATVHWLRHTGISDDINKRGRPVAHVRDDAGHSSSSTTDRYNDIELTERHRTAKRKKAASKPG